jgi:hypothetical protein
VILIDRTSFMFIRHTNLFIVAATRSNPNAALIFEFLFQKLRILKSYLNDNFNDESIQSNFTLVYELMDETMDYGFVHYQPLNLFYNFYCGIVTHTLLFTQWIYACIFSAYLDFPLNVTV